MKSHSEQKHPYHLVDPSPWPLVGAIAAGIMFSGTVMFMHDGPTWVMVVGVLSVLAVMV
ncbi:MAG TPA: cytochrome c oxidase subunit 3, partial [Stellaceae bacterium]|nr:cytochrome c oxidase subunit 3 [Stellaceae bacterium]